MRNNLRNRLMLIARKLSQALPLVIGLIFLGASIGKLSRPYDFLATVYSYGLAGPWTGFVVAFALPWLELVLGVCLLSGLFVRGSLLVGTSLIGMFVFAKASGVRRHLEIGCGCTIQSEGEVIGISDVVTTAALLVFSAFVLFHQFRSKELPAIDQHLAS